MAASESLLLSVFRLQEMEILYKKEKEEADLLLEQQRLVGVHTSFDVSLARLTTTVPDLLVQEVGLDCLHIMTSSSFPYTYLITTEKRIIMAEEIQPVSHLH